jgi:anaerobic magnesium-protoporphyrin IX monomethyl ester cyclase
MAFLRDQYDVVLVSPPAEAILEIYDMPDFPAIGIAYVGAALERLAGVSPALIDGRLSRLTLEQTIDQIVALRPRVVGLTAMTPMIATAARVAQGVKERIGDAVCVIGGFHASALPERTLREFPVFDYAVAGEGELAFAELASAVLAARVPPPIAGVFSREGAPPAGLERGALPPTLDELGQPGWHLYDPDVIAERVRALPVMSQRGCPFSCNFCSRPYGQAVRRRTPRLVIDEIERNVGRYGVDKIHFFDETFTVDRRHTRDLCEELLKRRLPERAGFTSLVHANTIDAPLARLMKAAGCVWVGFGVESGDEGVLARMKKGVTKEGLVRARRILKEAGLTTIGYFTLGHPHETRRAMWRTLAFAARLNPDVAAIGIIVPYPGTEIWDLAVRGEGGYARLSPDWSDYNKQLGNAVELRAVGRREVEFYQLLGYALHYLWNLRLRDMARVARQHLPLLLSIVAKIAAPHWARERGPLFRNDGGRLYASRSQSPATAAWGGSP